MELRTGTGRVAGARLAILLTLIAITAFVSTRQPAKAYQFRSATPTCTVFSVAWGQSRTFPPGTIIEALQSGHATLIGGGGSRVVWTFSQNDIWPMDNSIQTVKNADGKAPLDFRAWQ